MRASRFLILLPVALAIGGCAGLQPPPAADAAAASSELDAMAYGDVRRERAAPVAMVAAAPMPAPVDAVGGEYAEPPYTLDSGDKLRIVVFGQDGLSNSYSVDAAGRITMPLIGSVKARGLTPAQLSRSVAAHLRQGYIREPHVAVEVETYRPFFILGEVTAPGQYSYVANMTAETAVAIAGGFTPRASQRNVRITRHHNGETYRGEVPLSYPLRPGDTVVVEERWF